MDPDPEEPRDPLTALEIRCGAAERAGAADWPLLLAELVELRRERGIDAAPPDDWSP